MVQNFQTAKFFNGTWYETQSYGNELFQGFGTCSGLASRVTEDGQIVLKTFSYQPIVENYITIDGRSEKQYVTKGNADLPIKFDMYGGLFSGTYQAKIIDTDYENFAVVYLCQQGFLFRSEMAYVLSREQSFPDDRFNVVISNALYAIGLSSADLLTSINSNCGENEPVV